MVCELECGSYITALDWILKLKPVLERIQPQKESDSEARRCQTHPHQRLASNPTGPRALQDRIGNTTIIFKAPFDNLGSVYSENGKLSVQ